jgi:CubicO group peptidase (beta-lactamase class C family)
MKSLFNTLKNSALAVAVMLGTATVACSQPSAPSEPVKTAKKVKLINGKTLRSAALDKFLAQAMDPAQVPGLSLALINDQEIVFHRSLGVTNYETSEKVNDQTIFEAASLSKPLFAYFVLKLVQEGKFNLDKPLYEYLPHPAVAPEWAEDYKQITARLVLQHSTGFPNWSRGEALTMSHSPGQGFSYSGEAYQYLAAVVGTHLGVGYEAGLDSVFQEVVAKPLGLKHTSFTWNNYIDQHKAFGHQKGKVTDKLEHGPAFGAGYSLHTEATDYARFLIELMQGKCLRNEYRQLMLSEQNPFAPDNELRETGQTGWSLGLAVRPTDYGTRYLHTGNNHDFMAYCQIYPESGHGLVIFINSDTIEPFYRQLGPYLNDEF